MENDGAASPIDVKLSRSVITFGVTSQRILCFAVHIGCNNKTPYETFNEFVLVIVGIFFHNFPALTISDY